MNTIKLKEQIEKNLSEISPDNLKIIAEFVEFIKDKQEKNKSSSEAITYKPASEGINNLEKQLILTSC